MSDQPVLDTPAAPSRVAAVAAMITAIVWAIIEIAPYVLLILIVCLAGNNAAPSDFAAKIFLMVLGAALLAVKPNGKGGQ